jgi:amino acid transporter
MTVASAENATELKRSIGGGQLMLYGLGSMLGTSIYGLIGKATGTMGGAVWMAFLVAKATALFDCISLPQGGRCCLRCSARLRHAASR